MGTDAFVPCNCYPDKASTPPCPPDWLEWEEGRLYLKEEHKDNRDWRQVEDWKQRACPHPCFQFVWERVANGTGISLFLDALEGHDFRLLHRLGGELAPELAQQALQEIARFRQLPSLGQTTELLRGDEEINTYVADRRGIFLLNPTAQLNAGVDPHGFFLQCRQTHAEVFRAHRFEHHGHTFRNLDNGQSYDTPLEFKDGLMEVKTRTTKPEDFEGMIASLEALYQASVAMQRPVYFT